MSFSFGQGSTSGGGSSGLFSTSGNTTGGNLFGGSKPAAQGGSGLFGQTTPASGSPFGGTTPASTSGGLFGGVKPATTGGFGFGGTTAGTQSENAPGTTPSLFGGNTQNAGTSQGATTPSTNKTTNMFQSTTPMGAPAGGIGGGQSTGNLFNNASTAGTKPSLFGGQTQQQTSSATGAPGLFPSAGTQAKPAPATSFGGFSGLNKGTSSQPAQAPGPGPNLFPPNTNPAININPPASSSSTGAAPSATAGSGTSSLFPKLGQSNSNDPQYPKLPQSSPTPTGASPFGGSSQSTAAQPAPTAATTSSFQFTNPSAGQQSAAGQPAAPPASASPFTIGGGQQSSAAQPPPASTAVSPFNLVGGTGSSAAQPATAAAANPLFAPKPAAPAGASPLFAPKPSASPSATPATTATSQPSLFNPTSAAPSATTTASGPSFQPTAPGPGGPSLAQAATDATKKDATLGASTTGPKPTPQSRLKNKSMDEIITRWANDLQKYQKEFQAQAQKVADWDRKLVTSSEQIQKLYGNTLEAERATAEVERQLTTVENDQSEIEYWLEHYEKQVDELLASQSGAGGVPGEALQGPDADRERAFKTAEKLNDRLTEMGKDLGSMVEEINDATKTLSTGAKADDPLSQIVRVLNGHLSQLQQIDQGTAQLQKKVTEAQNQSRNFGANSSLIGSSAADDFLRSYMGRR